MVTTNETTKKKHSTKAQVRAAVREAKKYLKAHPQTTFDDLAKMLDISKSTLSRHLVMRARTGRRPTTVAKYSGNPGLDILYTEFQTARKNYEEARKRLAAAVKEELGDG